MKCSPFRCSVYAQVCLSVLPGATPDAAAAKLAAFLDAIPAAGPAYAVQVVSADRVLLDFARGTRRASVSPQRAPVSAETPFYIASQTKAFVGLLAAQLDAKGVLRLESTLDDHWPGLRWPGGFDPKAWTLRQLLSHQVPLTADPLVYMEAYLQPIARKDYPSLLERHARLRAPGFKYGNLGYSLYGATLQKVTGRSWQAWMEQELLRPLGLAKTRVSTRTYPPGDVAWGHQWLGEGQGWLEVSPKSDGLMHAAGGLFSTPAEVGRWLQMHLRQAGPPGSGFAADVFQAAQQPLAKVDPAAKNAYELPCHGYALGWNICDFEGRTLYIHGGSYTGTRTMMAFSPELNVGIAVFSNSDNMTGWLVSRTIVQFFQYLVGHPKAEFWADLRISQYPKRVDQWLEQQRQEQRDVRGRLLWKGWSWKPSGRALKAYEGTFQTEDGMKTLRILLRQNRLTAALHAFQAALEPAVQDLFGAQSSPLDGPEPMAFERDPGGRVVRVVWRDEVFHRRPAARTRTR